MCGCYGGHHVWEGEMFCSQILDTRLSLIILLFKALVFVFVGFREFPLCFPALVGSRFEAVCLYEALVFSLSWFIIADCINNGFPCICLRSGPPAFPC